MKTLILGSNGQLGHSLKKQSYGLKKDFIFSTRNECNINDFDETIDYIETIRPEIIINCAAYTAVDKAETEIELADKTNHQAVKNISNICKKKGIIFIHISTDYVFHFMSSDIKKKPIIESDFTNPKSIYGQSKLKGEKAIIDSGCSFLILRTSWVFSEFGNNFLKTIIKIANKDEDLKIVDDQVGCPTYAPDIADAIIAVIKSIESDRDSFVSGVFNFASKNPVSWFQFAKFIFFVAKDYPVTQPNKIIPIKSSEYQALAPRPKYSVLSSKKIQKYFKIVIPSWENGVKNSLKNLNGN